MGHLFYRNFRLLILTIFLILVWGISSFQLLPRMEDPELSSLSSYIVIPFPGASAQRVESLVTEKIEQELLEIEEIKTIDSISKLGSSFMSLELQDTVRNFDQVWSEVRDLLADITSQLPSDALEPEYKEIDIKAYSLIVGITWNLDSPANYAILRRLALKFQEQLRSIPGTEEVNLFAEPLEEIVVAINPENLAALNIKPQELSQQIRLSDAKITTGQLYNKNNDLLIEVETELDSLDRIRNIPISFGNSGQIARLGDIALVTKGIREPPPELAIINGKMGVSLAARIDTTQRIDQWAIRAHQSLEQFRQELPQGISLDIISDQNIYVTDRLNTLFQNLFLGALLVFASTFFMMGWQSALVVSSALPLSLLMVFGAMSACSIPLHQVSVTGLVIALGLLIDNAIIVVDEVEHLLKQGLKPQKAIFQTVNYLAIPLLASNFTTILTFLPIALLPGSTGEFVSTIGLGVIISLLSSLFLSLTIIPALVGRINLAKNKSFFAKLKNQKSIKNHSQFWNQGFSNAYLSKIYRFSLNFILRKPLLGIILALILPVTGFMKASTLAEQFFPPTERDQFHIEFELPASASLEKTQFLAEKARTIMLSHPEITDVHWFLGTEAPSFYYNLPRRTSNRPNYAHGIVQLNSQQKVSALISRLQVELNHKFPSVQVLVRQLEQGPYLPAPIELRLYGSDLNILRELGKKVRLVLAQVKGITSTRASVSDALPKLAFNLDEEEAKLTGLDNTMIAQQLNANLEGTIGGSVIEDTEEIPIRVRLANRDRANLDQITTLELLPNNLNATGNLATIPLSTVSKLELVPELASISRRNGKRVNTIHGFVTAGLLPSTVLAEFKEKLAASNIQFPAGYSLEIGGEAQERDHTVGNLMSLVSVLLVVMVAILVLSFNSFRAAGIIILVGIGSIGLGLFSLWWFNYPLGFMAILGIVGLIGVAINDSIVVLASLRNHPQASRGNRKAIVEVIFRATRHVLTTTITTIVGFIPLLILGSKFWSPLAICVAGGVGGATLLALYFVPCLYLLMTSL